MAVKDPTKKQMTNEEKKAALKQSDKLANMGKEGDLSFDIEGNLLPINERRRNFEVAKEAAKTGVNRDEVRAVQQELVGAEQESQRAIDREQFALENQVALEPSSIAKASLEREERLKQAILAKNPNADIEDGSLRIAVAPEVMAGQLKKEFARAIDVIRQPFNKGVPLAQSSAVGTFSDLKSAIKAQIGAYEQGFVADVEVENNLNSAREAVFQLQRYEKEYLLADENLRDWTDGGANTLAEIERMKTELLLMRREFEEVKIASRLGAANVAAARRLPGLPTAAPSAPQGPDR